MTTPAIESMTMLKNRIRELEAREQELLEQADAYAHEQQRLMRELDQRSHDLETARLAKSEFLANLSHEIRTPLNAIIAMTDLLLETNLSTQQREFVDMIQAGGNSLIAMLNDVVDFSRIEAETLELERHPFYLRTTLEESLDLLAPRAAEKQIDLIYHIDEQTPDLVIGDSTRLRQILLNLLNTAIKATDKGEIVVLVTSRRLTDTPVASPPKQRIFLTIRDTGTGLAESAIEYIFQPFFQVTEPLTAQYGDTGLGLLISKRLIEMMDGTINVKSQPGKGTTLHVSIVTEIVTTPDQITQDILNHSRYPIVPSPDIASKRVLIVDDNSTSRSILSGWLKTWGITPIAATSAPQALEWILRGDTFDLAILDLHMPQMNGMALATRIRTHFDANSVPLVLLTAFPGEVITTADVEIAAVLTRPIKPAQCYQTIAPLLERSATQQPLPIFPVGQGAVTPSRSDTFNMHMAEQHPLRILLAEDNRINQKVALSLLRRLGYRADVVVDGLEALESLARQTYDIVLMDVQMPEMDGVQATQHIRKFLPLEKQPIIAAMTAHALQGDREHYLAQGMDDYISKPVKLQELANVLLKASKRKQAIEQGEIPPPLLSPPNDQLLLQGIAAQQLPLESFPLDVAVLEQFLGAIRTLAPQLANELIDTLLHETPKTLAILRQAVQEQDAESLCNAAHTFKPHCTQFGAMTMMMLCQELETISRSGSLDGAEERVAQLEREYAMVKDALESMRQQQQ